MDREAGIYFYRARYYDATIGRFLSEDPIGFAGGDNFYIYVYNNPLNLSDPWGLSGKNKGDGSGSGKNTNNPYKKCIQHPTKPNRLLCKRKKDGKRIDVAKPPGWSPRKTPSKPKKKEMCDKQCQKVVKKVWDSTIKAFVYTFIFICSIPGFAS